MRVLDCFAGLKGWSAPWAEAGHEVVTLEILSKFEPTICADILEWEYQAAGRFDVILASPPCQGFSVMNIGRNWTGPSDDPPHEPKTDKARHALRMVERTLEIIAWSQPLFWVMENPRAKLRKMPVMAPFECRTVTYCQYGEHRMKPTDLWSDRWPKTLTLAEPCKNGDPCHTKAPRGSRTGTQGMDSAESAKIPYLLARAVMEGVLASGLSGTGPVLAAAAPALGASPSPSTPAKASSGGSATTATTPGTFDLFESLPDQPTN